ncbi:MAG TPA: hypothetical protein VEU76_07140, partial [Candidatus Udaeobacter sp.]|nr:hypothetical protein [Candidatus Udaeobacter sp.]
MRRTHLALLLVLVAAACGKPLGGPQLTANDYKLYEAATTPASNVVAVIDSKSHSVERRLPLGAVDKSWTHLYSVASDRLTDTDPATGATLHTLRLPGTYQLPPATMTGMPGGLSPDGKFLVLESWDRTTSTPNATHLLVIDTSFKDAPVHVELTGWWEFDAISDDGQRLYLVEYLAPGQ